MTDFIELKIKPLVETLNSWEGIETFSSCEGHEDRYEPYVTFNCKNEESLIGILEKLKETYWKIILNDLATKRYGGVHYTLRYAPTGYYADSEDLKEIQGEISEIVELLSKEGSKSGTIENKFPVLKCKKCEEELFTILCSIEFELDYHYSARFPQLDIFDMGSDAIFLCDECGRELELEDPVSELTGLLRRALFK